MKKKQTRKRLEEERRNNFLNNIGDTQVFVTCTDILNLNNTESDIFNVKNGKIIKNN